MSSRLLRSVTAGVAACALLIPASAAASAATGEGGERAARTCLDTAGNPAAGAVEALNMVANCSFEAKDFVSNKHTWEYFGADGTARLATETLADGTANSFALIDTGAISNHIWQAVPTVPGRSYVVSADVKVEAVAGYTADSVFFAAKGRNPDGTQNQASTTQLSTAELSPGEGWTRKTFTFTAANWSTYVGLIKWAAQDSGGNVANTTIAMDNLTVQEEQQYELVWNDEFDGDRLDQQTWGYELGNVRGNEQQHYSSSAENVDVVDGNLVLTATDRPEADQYRNTTRWGANARLVKYNSGSVRTEGREEFLYGRIEARMQLPEGKGVFPAFWMLGADFHMDGRVNMEQGYSWPSTGELDIMEIIGAPTEERAAQGETTKADNSNAVAYGTPHFYYANAANGDKDGSYAPKALSGNLTTADDFADGYHVFGIDWTPDYIAWYVDDVVYNVMYFPTDATQQAGNQAFVASELERFQAAADSLNRPQYLQLNLATGGNWAGDAGDHLAEDGAALKVDWVRYYRSAAQQAAADAYYAGQPTITGAADRVMVEGDAADLLAGVTTDEGYHLEYSVNNEQMFVNGGVEGGRNEVNLVVRDSSDTAALQGLAPGVYSLHYSALAHGASYSGGITPEVRVARQTVLLTVLPEGLSGVEGEALSTVPLPAGWSWADGAQTLGSADAYAATFTNAADTVTDAADRRSLTISIPASQIELARLVAEVEARVVAECSGAKARIVVNVANPGSGSTSFDVETAYGSREVAVGSGDEASLSFASKLKHLPAGTVTVSATAVVDGETVTAQKQIDYAALACR